MSYHVKQYKRGKSIEQEIMTAIAKGLWWLVSTPFKLIFAKRNPGRAQMPANVSLDRNFAIGKWQEIEQLMVLGSPSNFSRAVMEADKLLDHLLIAHRTPGLTMGDRLKASEKRFSADGYNAAWQGHKVRNLLAHDAQFELTDFIARDAISNFKKAIEELI